MLRSHPQNHRQLQAYETPSDVLQMNPYHQQQNHGATYRADPVPYGSMPLNPLIYLYVPILILTPLYTYHMAVSHHQQPPYPHATVTSTACHYPQDIVFRYTMLIASSILTLTFYIVFRWIEERTLKIGYPKKISKWYFYFASGSMVCYSITIGTIDEKGIGKLHGPCAVIFFVVFLAIIVRMTIFIEKMRRWDTSVISHRSMFLKKFLAGYIVLVWVYCLIKIIQEQSNMNDSDSPHPNKQDIYVVIVEWNSVLVNLMWVLSFVYEWSELRISFDFYENKNCPELNY